MQTWAELKAWWKSTGECQVIEERLRDLDKAGIVWLPGRRRIYAALDATPLDKCRVAIIGQDPYPNPDHACGLAFSIPRDRPVLDPAVASTWPKGREQRYPPTFENILKEYQDDLNYPRPTTGDLSPWTKQGVLLWNAVPTVERGKPGSHLAWEEYDTLTFRIGRELAERACVLVLLGSRAQRFIKCTAGTAAGLIVTSHPSPRGVQFGNIPFLGSRVFTRVNDLLRERGDPPIEWRLP